MVPLHKENREEITVTIEFEDLSPWLAKNHPLWWIFYAFLLILAAIAKPFHLIYHVTRRAFTRAVGLLTNHQSIKHK